MWDPLHNTTTDTCNSDMEEKLVIRSVPFPTAPQQREDNPQPEQGLVAALLSACIFDGHDFLFFLRQ